MPKRGTASDRKAACRRRMPRSGKNCCGSNKDNTAARRRKSTRSVLPRQGYRRKAGKGFNLVCMNVLSLCADSKFEEPRSFLTKVLIVAVGSCGCGGLIRGLRNLGAPCEGVRVVTFCVVQKVTKKHTGRSPATHDSKLCRK